MAVRSVGRGHLAGRLHEFAHEDGIIDLERSRARLPDKPDDFFMKADEIAKNVYALTQQDRSAWTFELDLRPFGENW